MAIPPPSVRDIRFAPALPFARQLLNHRSFWTHHIKFHVLYRTRFWKELGYSGTITSDCSPIGKQSTASSYLANDVFDNTQRVFPNTKDCNEESREAEDCLEIPCLVGFIGGQQTKLSCSANHTPEDRKKLICQQLRDMFQAEEALEPVGYCETNWAEQEEGGTLSVLPPGVLSSVGHAFRQPVGCLHWAGTESAVHYNGYVEGAIRSGQRASLEVLSHYGLVSCPQSSACQIDGH